jgi:hypothetical protein
MAFGEDARGRETKIARDSLDTTTTRQFTPPQLTDTLMTLN